MMIEGVTGNVVGQCDEHTKRIVVPTLKEKPGLTNEVTKLVDVHLIYLQSSPACLPPYRDKS